MATEINEVTSDHHYLKSIAAQRLTGTYIPATGEMVLASSPDQYELLIRTKPRRRAQSVSQSPDFTSNVSPTSMASADHSLIQPSSDTSGGTDLLRLQPYSGFDRDTRGARARHLEGRHVATQPDLDGAGRSLQARSMVSLSDDLMLMPP